jgi:hypothetical protein
MESIYGNHLGIVINRADPEGRKRVQVFIPHLSNTLYDQWNSLGEDKSFKEINELGPTIISKLKQILPWAEMAGPFFGGGTPVTSNTANGKTTVNNSESPIGSYNPNNSTLNGFNNGSLTQSNGGNAPDTSGNQYTTTQYSFGTVVGGKDTTSNAEKYGPGVQSTNTGYGSLYQNLGPGTVAVGSGTGFQIGDIIKNQDGQSAMVVDQAGVSGVVDVFAVKNYNNDYKTLQNWSLVNRLGRDGVPSTNEGVQQVLAQNGATQLTGDGYGGYSAAQYLAAGADGNIGNPTGDPTASPNQIASQENTLIDSDGNLFQDPNVFPDPLNAGGKNIASSVTPNSNTASGSPNGVISIPKESAKVWVFFHGGDVQRPVYFACTADQV